MRVLLALVLVAFSVCAMAQSPLPDRVLHGEISGRDNHTYRNVPFDVPAGTTRITVDFQYTGKDQHTTIDLGLLGPDGFRGQDGFRGWSGGSKHIFTVSATDATPSFLPGAIRPGQWTLLLGIPNIRPNAHAQYTARIWFAHDAAGAWGPDALNLPLRSQAGWYRGDLHMHGAHSDGSCTSQSGTQRVPCPLFVTVNQAVARGLDFIALSDHNTISQFNDIRELQPYFDRLLLIPAREITTFQGHANLFGVIQPVDFRVGSASVPDWNTLLRNVAPLHGLISINHPIRADDESCMGCGWASAKPIDMHLVQAIEAVNGLDAMVPALSGVSFWQDQLNKGFHLTAVGGSDNHDAKLVLPTPGGSSLIGTPTTVVHASELSMPAILEGIRAGHVFIDVQGTRDRMLDLAARIDNRSAEMGDTLSAPAGGTVHVTVSVAALAGDHIDMIVDGKPLQTNADFAIHDARQTVSFDWPSDGKRHWIRADVRGAGGELLMVGNPVYING
ncbi:CehA/McbA family metallohydrolase [Dyella psychrodurans]|uniref:PHP domain-containing protein n=1 Tax=Dyella psychrodurans TaxID=1927960 RepID=A0A370XEK3_9GAMM|nr:CehA/McbA family metallohydrolase [Dyella psychrodurans]RDS86717.1 PHP domain-containing protein [Dyella psychrodurans]